MSPLDWSKQISGWVDEWHEDLLRFLAGRAVARDDAEDLAQEVYLRLLRVDRNDLIRQPRSYLMRIAANLLHEWRLRSRQARPHDAESLEGLEAEDCPESSAMQLQRRKHLVRELQRLPPHVQAALILQTREELTHEQIAARMNVSPRMVKRYLLTAYSALRNRLPGDM